MIRINLLGVERPVAGKAISFDIGQQVTLLATLILVAAALGVGWWYWSLRQTSIQLDAELAAAQLEATRLRTLLAEVETFNAQRQLLQQRVALIQELRGGQSIPVQLLDHVSRSLPDMLWLTGLQQQGEEVTLEGRSTTLIALSDFVGNLSNGTLLQRPIEIVNSQVQPATGTGPEAVPELIQFTVRARINLPGPPAAGAAAGRGRGAAAAAPAGGRQGGAG